jgi:hypothetical protein
MNGFIDHLYTLLGITSTYNVIANLYTLQIITAPDKHFPAGVVTCRFLATASNTGDSSASHAQVLLSSRPCRIPVNCKLTYGAISSQPLLQSSTKLPPLN